MVLEQELPLSDLLGIAVGHLYHYAATRKLLRPPGFLKQARVGGVYFVDMCVVMCVGSGGGVRVNEWTRCDWAGLLRPLNSLKQTRGLSVVGRAVPGYCLSIIVPGHCAYVCAMRS